MSSVKLVLWKHDQKKDGTYPLALRITKNRKSSYVFTGQYILEKEWDSAEKRVKKSHPNYGRLNNMLLKKISEAQSALLDDESNDENLSTKQLQKKVKRNGVNISFYQLAADRIRNKYIKGTFSVAKAELSMLYNIQEFSELESMIPNQSVIDAIMERRKIRNVNGQKNKEAMIEELKKFSKNTSLAFEEIDTAFLNKFKSFCISFLGQKTRTVTNQLIFIRTVFNMAIKENVTSSKHYPFAGEKEKIRINSGNKIGLTIEEIKKIEELDLEEGSSMWHTKNVWLFSYYFAGIRIADVLELRWSNFMDGRLYYQMNKNEKPVSLKTPDKALHILKLYEGDKLSNEDYLFPFLKKANQKDKEDLFRKTRNATKYLNKNLKKIAALCNIEKNLSNHISRHSFGNIAGDRINPLMLQKLYRHSNLKTTINYQANFIHKEADDALDQVLNS